MSAAASDGAQLLNSVHSLSSSSCQMRALSCIVASQLHQSCPEPAAGGVLAEPVL